MRILGLASYPESSASSRFRLYALKPYFERHGHELVIEPFFSERAMRDLYRPGRRLSKMRAVGAGGLRRIWSTLSLNTFDAVFVQREAALVGPPIFERIAATKMPLIFDFDDALWIKDTSRSRSPVLAAMLKSASKFNVLTRTSAAVVAGSSVLAARAARYNDRVMVAPTVVSREAWRPLPYRASGRHVSSTPVIGWIGSHSTAHQLDAVWPALSKLRHEGYAFKVRVVGAAYDQPFAFEEVERVVWDKDTEVENFRSLDIGLAPMGRGEIYEGKCGFKQLQYMAVGVPQVCSKIGGARDFIKDEVNALVVADQASWYVQIKRLLDDPELRAALSRSGRSKVESSYCIEAVGSRIVDFVAETIARSNVGV